jgi:RNA polymerase primary sigma factor
MAQSQMTLNRRASRASMHDKLEAYYSQDTTSTYRNEVKQVDMLSPEQVKYLSQIIKQAQRRASDECRETEEAKEARRQLIEANLRLVLHIARKYRGFGVDLMDLVQEGNLGLMYAIEKFDHTRGYMFSTYATWWIRQYIARAIASQGRMIRLPQYKLEEIKRMKRVRLQLEQHLQNEPTLDELAQQMETNVEEVAALIMANPEVVSLDAPHKRGDDKLPLSEILEDDPTYSPERIVLKKALQKHIQELLNHLTEREKIVLELRYGLNTYEHSLQDVSRKIGLSHEAVRQVELRALHKLSHLSRTRMLQDFLRL